MKSYWLLNLTTKFKETGARGIVLISLILVIFLSNGCESVSFYQKGRLVDPIMAFDEEPTSTHFYQKSFYSREGSTGGIGTGAGGGCGCY